MWWIGLASLLVVAAIVVIRSGRLAVVPTWLVLTAYFQCSSAGHAMPTVYYKNGGNGIVGPDAVIWMIHGTLWTLTMLIGVCGYRRALLLHRRRAGRMGE